MNSVDNFRERWKIFKEDRRRAQGVDKLRGKSSAMREVVPHCGEVRIELHFHQKAGYTDNVAQVMALGGMNEESGRVDKTTFNFFSND